MFGRIIKFDWILISCVGLLLGVSLAVLYSISTIDGPVGFGSVFVRQCIFVAVGLGGLVFFALANYHYLRSYVNYIYFGTLLLLILVLVLGKTVRGTVGWIALGSFHLQPVEIAKLSLIVFMASFISQKRMELGEVSRLLAPLVLIGAMILLVIEQPDFGSAMVLTGTWVGMTMVGGLTRRMLLVIFTLGFITVGMGWMGLAQYQKDRVMNLIRPSADLKGTGYNVNQSIIAVGSGGMIGKGIGHGSQSQLNFLPEKHTDFIFASMAEELGLIGSCLVISLFLLMLYRMKIIASSAPDNFGYLLAVGIQIMFFLQILENIGMNIGIMPVTGIPLPLMSYGGSSVIASLAAIGILLNIQSSQEALIAPEE